MTAAVDGPASELESIPRTRLIALYVLAVSVGLLPFALVIRSGLFLLIAALSIVVAVVIVTRTTIQYAGQPPAAIEIVLGLLGSSTFGVICGVFGIFFFILVRSAVALYEWLILSVPWTAGTAPAESWARYLCLIVPAAVVLISVVAVCSEDAPGFVTKLYPSLPGQRSPYFALSQQPKQLWLLGLKVFPCAVAIILVASFPYLDHMIQPLSGHADFLTYLSSLLVLLILSAFWITFTQDLWDTKSSDLPRARNQPLVRKIQTLMEAAGYQVRLYPQTGNAKADPLIALLDFVAIRSDRSMAGGVRVYADPVLLRRELASLPSAVWALEDQLSKNRTAKIDLEPVLFLADGAAQAKDSAEVSAFAGQLNVRIIDLAEIELDEIVGDKDDAARASRAKQLVDASASNLAAPPAAAAASGLTA
jgi:hypothetical protein